MNKVSKFFVVLAIFVLGSFALLFATFSKGIQLPLIHNVVSTVAAPVQYVFSMPTHFLSEQKFSLSELMNTYEENKELKRTIFNLEAKRVENDTLKSENESLRASLGIMSQFPENQYVPGRVIVRSPASWINRISIDIGKKDGIAVDSLVIANGGLMGVVIDVEEDTSVVKLFTTSDDFTKVPIKVRLESKEIYGILAGYDSDTNHFIVNQLNATDDIPVGSEVVTSDLAGNTPANLPVGKVASVTASSNNLNRELYIEPITNFSNIYSVLVVRKVNE